jgi:hypothetical protein
MTKTNKPNSEEEVFEVMRAYCQKKGYSFSDTQLRFFAENCYLLYESKGWCNVKYWPPLAMKWILNEKGKFNKGTINYKKPKPFGKSVRNKIMEQENDKQ